MYTTNKVFTDHITEESNENSRVSVFTLLFFFLFLHNHMQKIQVDFSASVCGMTTARQKLKIMVRGRGQKLR